MKRCVVTPPVDLGNLPSFAGQCLLCKARSSKVSLAVGKLSSTKRGCVLQHHKSLRNH